MDRPKHRRLILSGVALLVGGALLLLGRHWTSTPAPTALADKPVAHELYESEALQAATTSAETTAPAAVTTNASADGGATFRGRVVDAVTRQPVPKFEIQLLELMRPGIPGNARASQSFQSVDGRFAWQRAPVGKWMGVVAAPRYQRFRIEALSISANKATREFVIPLRSGHTLKGRVFDQSSGVGIGDAYVQFRDVGSPLSGLAQPGTVTRSSTDGTFVLDGVPEGDTIVTASARDHALREISVIAKEDTPLLEIGLTTGGKIAGMVVAADGTPVQGWLGLAGPDMPYSAKLDETGAFSFANRPAGHYRLRANTPAGSANMEFDLAENEIKEGMLLKVGEGRSVRGMIRGVRAEQLEHTTISLYSESKSANFLAHPDEQGAYVVKGVPPGRARVDVDVDMSRYAHKSVDVRADQDTVLNIEFPPGARLSGRVTQSAKPAADRNVWVGSPGGDAAIGYRARTTQDGNYEIEGVPPGEYRVSVDRDANRIVAIAGDTVVNFDIPLVQIGGRVVEEGGTVPIVGAGVHVVGIQPQTALVRNYREADDFGQFQLTGVEAGEIVLTVYKPGYEMVREKIVYSSPITNRTITLRRSAGVEVRVRSTSDQQATPLFLSEKMPGSDSGISLWIPVNREGIGYLPDAFAGSTLRIQRSGSKPIVVEEWDGQSLDLKFESRQ